MKLKKTLLLNIAIAFIISSSIIILSEQGLFKRLELGSMDFLFRLRASTPCNPHIVIVEIDDENISKLGRWPWRRTRHASIVKALKALGAKYIYFDILFSEASSNKDDNELAKSIKNAGNVYLPFVFQENSHSFDLRNALFPIKEFSEYTKGTGSTNIPTDMDGVLRMIPLYFRIKNDLFYHIALQIALDYSGSKIKEITPQYLLLSSPAHETKIPLIEGNKMLINWPGKWEDTFKRYSFLDVINAHKDIKNNTKPAIDIDSFRDSICIVAVTAIGLYDIKPISLQPAYPVAGAIAVTIGNILDNKFLNVPAGWINWLLIYALALIPSLAITGERALRESLSAIIAGILFFIIVLLFFQSGTIVEFYLPLLSLFASYIVIATCYFVIESKKALRFFKLAETDGLTGLYNIRYFKQLLKAECVMATADISKRFCIIMSDIDHFKHFNDTYGHQVGDLVLKEVANVMRDSVRSSDIVARYGGEEKIVLLRGASMEQGLSVAEKIRKNVEDYEVADKDHTYKVKISIGVSIYKPQDDEETVIKRADEGLYKAKESGRNRVETVEVL